MRYFIIGWLLLVAVIVSIAGFRGGVTRRTPIEVFPDMDRQPKLRPQTANGFFADGLSSQGQAPFTVARGSAWQDTPVNTGREPGTTNFIQVNPIPVTARVMARGQERFEINCLPCHGPQGDGKGITTKYGMTIIANLHDARIVRQGDGEIFNTISNGKNQMQGYGANIEIQDRWAIIAYLRALQLSHLGTIEDVPAAEQAALKK
jgi:mono/diheme cytochrome c family protein